MTKPRPAILHWLYRLDAYSNAELGRARTLWAVHDRCVGCDTATTSLNDTGLCRRCAAQCEPDPNPIALFRPVRSLPSPTA